MRPGVQAREREIGLGWVRVRVRVRVKGQVGVVKKTFDWQKDKPIKEI